MAAYNEILTGRHNRFIQKLFSMKGRPPAPQLGGDIQMSHGFFHGAENRFLESWYRWGVATLIAAVAAQTNGFSLRNPAGSNVIAVVEKMAYWTTGAAEEVDLSLGLTNADLTTVVATSAMDGRQAVNSQSTSVASVSNLSPNPLNIFGRDFIITNVPRDYILVHDSEINILPGNALRLTATVANQNLGWTLNWRERTLEESERQ